LTNIVGAGIVPAPIFFCVEAAMYHILILLVSLAGQPIGVAEGPSAQKFDTMEACVQAAPAEITKAVNFIKENGASDKVMVGMAMCWNVEQTEHSEPVTPDKTKMETPMKSGEKDI
jgi:hypothetical protein